MNRVCKLINADKKGKFPVIYKKDKKKIVGTKAAFVDLSIYSTNRNFRLIGNSKVESMGKSPLKLYNIKTKKVTDFDNISKQTFLETMACHIKMISESPLPVTYIPPLVFGIAKKTLINISRSSRIKVNAGFGKIRIPNDGKKKYCSNSCEKWRVYFNEKVLSKWPHASKNGRVTCIKEFGNKNKTTVIGLSGVRFCKNVEREHKNNNIYFSIPSHQMSFIQKCHSHGCRNFRSEEHPINFA